MTAAETETWMQKMGTKFVEVWFYMGSPRSFQDERHVDDHDTLLTTITMSMDRHNCRHALWDDGEKWCVLDRDTGDTKRYPSRSAAEMVVIHAGR